MRQQPHSQYSGPRSPGIRMMEPLIPDVRTPYEVADSSSLETYHMFDKAHLVMQAEEGIMPRQDAVDMLAALREMEQRGVEKVRMEVGGGMHSGEYYLIRLLGYDVGGRIHLGRSTGDLSVVWRRVLERNKLLELAHRLNAFRATVLQVAEENLDVVMPGYTTSQHAQPITLGHQLMAWASILERHSERAMSTYQRVNQSPAGAAIMTGSNFPMNRQRTADLMGFDEVIKNTFDAILSHDDTLETLTVAASVNLSMSKWANDINFWYTSEAGYIDIPDRFCGTSSIMMQKKNPSLLSDIRAASASTIGGLVTTFAGDDTLTGEFTAEDLTPLVRALDLAAWGLGRLNDLLPALEVKKDRMREMAGSYWAQATDVAGALVAERGLPWRIAHQIVGTLVRISYERGIRPKDVTTELLDEAANEYMGETVTLSRETLEKALDPVNFITGRTLYGGPAPEECRRRLPEYHTQLEADQRWVAETEGRLRKAEKTLERAIDALVA